MKPPKNVEIVALPTRQLPVGTRGKTARFDWFTPNPTQPTSRVKCADLVDSIQKNGFFADSFAISVFYSDDTTLSPTIAEGHRRRLACHQLGVPVHFVVLSKEEGVRMMTATNAAQKQWGLTDWVEHYAQSGNPHYQTLLSYARRGIGLGAAASMLYGHSAGSHNVHENVRDGKFVVRTTGEIDRVVNLWTAFQHKYPEAAASWMISAFSAVIHIPEFEDRVFLDRLRNYPKPKGAYSDRESALLVVEDIYNFRSHGKLIALAVEAKNQMKARNAARRSASTLPA